MFSGAPYLASFSAQIRNATRVPNLKALLTPRIFFLWSV
jgi:hypothetical protein